MKITALLATLLFATSLTAARSQEAQPGRSFEVVSIRPGAAADAEMIPVRMKADRARLHYVNVSLRECLRMAYGVKAFQISGPAWIGNRFNIEARYPAGATEDDVPEMLQALLKDRFHLQAHREMKDHAVYALIVGKKGARLKPTQVKASDYPDSPTRRPGTPVYGDLLMMGSVAGMRLKGPAVTMHTLCETLSVFTDQPVVDQTGLDGRYDIDVAFIPEERLRMHGGPGGAGQARDAADDRPEPHGSVFEAVQEYGLRLEPRKAPVEVIVVDHLDKTPTEN